MALRMLPPNCPVPEGLDGAHELPSSSLEGTQASMPRACSGDHIWNCLAENGLMLIRCLFEALYPGVAAEGILAALQHFYDEYDFRLKTIVRNLKTTVGKACPCGQ